MRASNRYVFDNVEVVEDERRLVIGGKDVPIGSRALTVLLTLLAHRDRVVSKDELLEAAWPRRVVEKNNLVVQVGALRELLGRRAIATIPGRGYKFSGGDVVLAASSCAGDTALQAPKEHRCGTLFGRDAELRTLGGLIARHRIVTLAGPTGIGKTRLAQRLLADAAHRFTHGGAWVDLTEARGEGAVLHTMAHALKLGTVAGEGLEGLSRGARALNMLVVVDDTDGSIDEASRIVQALSDHATGLSFLLTGQRPLHLRGDRVVALGPLAVPAPDADVQEALRCGAVALFVERASAADSRFALTGDNVAGVIEVCRRLDGVPLAIDMAASRTTLLGVAELASMLGKRLNLLSTSRRDAMPRHRTLRRAIEWSHGLLGERERVVLRRLSVFAASFTLDTALEVVVQDGAGPGGLDEWAMLDAFTELVDRSLMIADGSEPPRYRLPESMRIFAREQLALSGEAPRLQRRHALVARDALAAVFSTRADHGGDTHARLSAELGNACEAMAWSLEHDQFKALLLAPPEHDTPTALRREAGSAPPGDCARAQRTSARLADARRAAAHWA